MSESDDLQQAATGAAGSEAVQPDELLSCNNLPDGTWSTDAVHIRLSQIAIVDLPYQATGSAGGGTYWILPVRLITAPVVVCFIFQDDKDGIRVQAFHHELVGKLAAYLRTHP